MRTRILTAALATVLGLASTSMATLVTPTAAGYAPTDPNTSPFYSPSNMVDDSGLSGTPTLQNYTTITHSPASSSTAWTTRNSGSDYFAAKSPPVLQFDLGQEYDLTGVVMWGYYFLSSGVPNLNGNEPTLFDVTVSGAGGSNTVTGLTRSVSGPDATLTSFGTTLTGDTVTMTFNDNAAGSVQGGDRVSLGELKFVGVAVPEPSSQLALLLGAALMLGLVVRRK